MSNIKELLSSITSNNLTESKSLFESILSDKLLVKLNEAKLKLAQAIFETKDEDDEEETNNDEVDHKTVLGNLKKAADSKPLSDEEGKEYKLDGSVDGRSKKPKYKKPVITHADGSKSEIDPDHAQAIINMLEHPDHFGADTPKAKSNRETILKAINQSPAHLEKVKAAALQVNAPKFVDKNNPWDLK